MRLRALAVFAPAILCLVGTGGVSEANSEKTIKSYRANAIAVRNQSAQMRYRNEGWITTTLAPVGSGDDIPTIIQKGDLIEVEDHTLLVGHIRVTKCLQRMTYNGDVLCERGQIMCTVVENPSQFPDVNPEVGGDRLWITVEHCFPLF